MWDDAEQKARVPSGIPNTMHIHLTRKEECPQSVYVRFRCGSNKEFEHVYPIGSTSNSNSDQATIYFPPTQWLRHCSTKRVCEATETVRTYRPA